MLSGSLALIGHSQAKTVKGNITYYYGEGKIGAHGKKLASHDCALKIGFDNPPAGTKIKVVSDKGKQATVYKWDMGRLPNAVIDVMPGVFKTLAGSLSYGVIHGKYTY
nr:RlpA-like double-psi beta-barrel domain-containing protein [Scopulibacillus daqui]